MRIRMIWLVLPAILAASQADRALAQERIDTDNFSAAAKAELFNGAQAIDILNRIDALYDPALVGFLDAKVRRLQVSLYDFFGDQLWPAPKGAEAFYREVRLYQEHHGTGSFTQRTFVPAGSPDLSHVSARSRSCGQGRLQRRATAKVIGRKLAPSCTGQDGARSHLKPPSVTNRPGGALLSHASAAPSLGGTSFRVVDHY